MSEYKKKKAEAIARMMSRTAELMGVSCEQLMAGSKGRPEVCRARMVFIWLVRPVLTDYECAAILGRRTHGTINGARRKCGKVIEHDEQLRAQVNMLMDEFAFERERYAAAAAQNG